MEIVRENEKRKAVYEVTCDKEKAFELACEVSKRYGKREGHKLNIVVPNEYFVKHGEDAFEEYVGKTTLFDGTPLYDNIKIRCITPVAGGVLYQFDADMIEIPKLGWFSYLLSVGGVKEINHIGANVLGTMSKDALECENIDVLNIDKSDDSAELNELCKFLAHRERFFYRGRLDELEVFDVCEDYMNKINELASYYKRALQMIDFELVEETTKYQRRMTPSQSNK